VTGAFKIGLYPGDGIGPEVMDETVRLLERIQEHDKTFRLETTHLPWGTNYYIDRGMFVPDDFLSILGGFDAILLGAVGDPKRVPDGLSLRPLVQTRQRFDQYACVRPARLFNGVKSPLSGATKIDLVVLRENSEGEYLPCGGRLKPGESEEVAIQTAVHTRLGVERILRFGYQMARRRRHRLTMITKSNALSFGFVLWDEVLEHIRAEYPDVETDRQHADAAAMNFVRRPESFDVVVASNLFGDILSDLSAAITGGMGLAPSANLNPERTHPSLFEPVHGSAPDIVGRGIANPIAMVLSAAMMLEWLDLERVASRVRAAVENALFAGARTPDLGGTLTTRQMAAAISERID
jgi:tartrate dehydrogenase/decarboxylase / D-malate dehydrogenase